MNANLCCGVLLLALTATAGAPTRDTAPLPFGDEAAAGQGKSTVAPIRDMPGRGASHEDYQVPAGTWLYIELRTPIASDSSQRADTIRGMLKSAVTSDGVELVPSGAVVLGTVTDAAPALNKKDRARVAFRFNVLEHPSTGSRVAIHTEIRAIEVEAGKKKRDAEGPAAFNQIRLEPGADVSMPLREPFLVRIPGESKAGK